MDRPGRSVGRYELEEQLGRGAMGVVWRARDSVLGRAVALKLLAPHLAEDREFRERFLREASTLARLDSPHIIAVFDHGEVDGQLFLVTQLVSGGDLGQRLERQGPLPATEALALVEQLAGALADAHAGGVVHRDVKPSNVLLRARTDHGSEPGALFGYLCDFGIAQTGDDGGTRTGMVVGTWGYLAPERARGEAATPASDVYSLGCVLWAALTGRAPYGGTEVQVAMAHQSEPVRQLDADGPGVDRALVQGLNKVLAGAMAKAPGERFASAAALADAVRRVREVSRAAAATGAAEQTVLRPLVVPGPPVEDTVLRPATGSASTPVSSTPPPVVAPAAAAGSSRRLALVLAAVLAVLVVAAGSAVALLLARGDGAAADPSSSATQTSGTRSRTSPSATPTPQVTCWNGAKVAARTSCPAVRGVAGIRWLFPSYAAARGCTADRIYDGKVRALGCEVQVPGGGTARLVYSEWGSHQLALAHYRRKYGQFSSRTGGVEAWPVKLVGSSRTYQTSRYVEGLPYSVTVASGTPERTRAAARLLRIRSLAERQGLR